MGLDLALVRTRIGEMHGELTADTIGLEGFQILLKMPTAVEGMTTITMPLNVPSAPAATSTVVGTTKSGVPAPAVEEKAKTIPLPSDFKKIRTDIEFKLEEKKIDSEAAAKLPPMPNDAPPTHGQATVTSIGNLGQSKTEDVQIRKPKIGSDS